MKIEILKTAADVARRAALLFQEAVKSRPDLVLALPTGRTPIEMYALLAQARREGALDVSQARCFNLDEVLLPRALPQTFFQFMTQHAWGPLGFAPERARIPNGEADDPEAEAERYEGEILAAGGIDLGILGIGTDGHIAYNLPGQAAPRTHVITLDAATEATLGGDLSAFRPIRGITMGVETLLSAKQLLLLATGNSKAEAIRRLRDDPPSDRWPCTLFRGHAHLTVLADEAAASQL